MVTLPGISSYSSDELESMRRFSPAFARYEGLLAASSSLARRRHEAWMQAALAEFFQRSSTEDICRFWSETADEILRSAWGECGLDKLPAALFALGKQGALELNLSSDIDVLVVADPEAAYEVEKALRRFRKVLNPDEGFLFRLDFDLRPGGKMGAILVSPSQFQDYYWSQGETWERLALVRLRLVTGDKQIAGDVYDLAARYCYRKFLDFTLLDDLKALRSRVHQTGFQRHADEIHLKLEVGGIRDIELFTHSLLILNGGKLPELRTISTSEALRRLAARQLMPQEEADFLLESYWQLRHVENLVQAVEDRQTHALPRTSFPVDVAAIVARMSRVDEIVSGLLGAVDLEQEHLPADESAQIEWLRSLGFGDDVVASTWPSLINATALSHKNDRDERARREFLFSFVSAIAENRGLDRRLGLEMLAEFVRATRAKATFFTMLLRAPRLIRDLARLFCLSPYLASILVSRPELLDHFVLQENEKWSDDTETLLKQMIERKLLSELWSATQFLADHDLVPLFQRTTETADAIAVRLLEQLKREFEGSSLEIVSMGKWGGREMGLRSDLDFVFVSTATPCEADFKIARRFISRLTDPSKGGMLYDIDLRLRPSGRSGPLLVTRDALHEYWSGAAQVWERQAYLRARPLGTLSLDKSRLLRGGLSAAEKSELSGIRGKLLRVPTAIACDVKYAPGALLDIEFVAQTACLALSHVPIETSTEGMIRELIAVSPEWRSNADELLAAYSRMRDIEQMLQLLSAHKTSEAKGAVREELLSLLSRTCAILNALDPTGFTRLT